MDELKIRLAWMGLTLFLLGMTCGQMLGHALRPKAPAQDQIDNTTFDELKPAMGQK